MELVALSLHLGPLHIQVDEQVCLLSTNIDMLARKPSIFIEWPCSLQMSVTESDWFGKGKGHLCCPSQASSGVNLQHTTDVSATCEILKQA